MKIVAFLIAIYTLVMLSIHVSTGKVLRAWATYPCSWISRWLPLRRALRIEGAYWLLAVAAWFLWRSLMWKILVVLFALIHLGFWGVGEYTASRKKRVAFTTSPTVKRIIVVFDSVEALVLTALGFVAVLYLTNPR